MQTRIRLPLIALILAAPAGLSAQSAQDFQLPPNPAPTASPRVQGPVDTESGNIPVTPRVIATPTPTPRPTAQPLPLPTPSPSPIPSAAPVRSPTVQNPAATRRQPVGIPIAEERLPLEPGETVPIVPAPLPAETPPFAPSATPSPTPAPGTETASGSAAEGANWLWPAIGGGLLALLGLGYIFSRRRKSLPPPAIEKPVVGRSGERIAPSDLQFRAEAIKLTRSVMNATLHYRVTLINRSAHALSNVELGADVVSAHGGVPVEDQVASATQLLEKRHAFERIAPGRTVRFEGQITMPLSQARVIRQGKAALFVPLLRVRLDGSGEEPQVRTFVIGQGVPDGSRVMPFRIDEGPRSYAPIAARALD